MTVRSALLGAAIGAGAATLSAFFFVAFFAPGWPRTLRGWLIATALGLPRGVQFATLYSSVDVERVTRFHQEAGFQPWAVQMFRRLD